MTHSRPFRPAFHVTAPTGRLNDPNGMFIEGETLHAYYQKDPAFPFGAKRTGWGHVSTPLKGEGAGVWTHHPDALYPDAAYDRHGCYSGGAARDDEGRVWLFYTGNLKETLDTGAVERRATQNIVSVKDPAATHGGIYRRDPANPLIDGPAPGYTAHYRDPMVTRDPDAAKPGHRAYRMVLGAQRSDETGAVVLYRSDDLFGWEFAGELSFDLTDARPGTSPDIIPGGYMWECPNLLTIRDESDGERYEVLIFCPQGLEPVTGPDGATHYASSDQCGYIVGRLEGTVFRVLRGFSELDYGHHFYAPQVVAEREEIVPASYILLGWMGLPAQDETPSVESEGWVHSLTLPRRLTLRGAELRQRLVLPAAVGEGDQIHTGDFGHSVLHACDQLKQQKTTFSIKDASDSVVISGSYLPVGHGVLSVTYAGDTRTTSCGPGELEIFVDGATVEITAQDGAVAFSIAAFPTPGVGWGTIEFDCDAH